MPVVTIDQLAAARATGAYVLDVREPSEYVEGHVPGAELLPMGQVPVRHTDLPKGEPVYVICRSGNRSRTVMDYLVRAGHDAYSVDGGTMAWISQGHPVVTGPNRDRA
ncbi:MULTISPECIES: rhodanese-like domain-containing protein [Georgenia]|jgi:rhodanese-related sulfurtransferase|uniref:Rhodanese-related sulfurtransferase n=1 Tax=Georgenia muralis TaxID=154117 RepID=A0A3N4Z6E1_9MICO|nr:rhodanese-like domain-containing protein [Georgenia muralis]RPF26720.1 rhodanese-related sulfurtransferase [Georgenia muralis]